MALRLNRETEPMTTPAGHRLDLVALAAHPDLAPWRDDPDTLRLHATTRAIPVFTDWAGRPAVTIDDAAKIHADLAGQAAQAAAAQQARNQRRNAEQAEERRRLAERTAAQQRRAELQRALDELPPDNATTSAWEAWQRQADEHAAILFTPSWEAEIKAAEAADPLHGLNPLEQLKARARGGG